jgi:hypothetical protein
MIGAPGLSEKTDTAIEKLMNPPCPRFPGTSIIVGKLAAWFYDFSAWFGLQPRHWGKPLLVLSARRREVEWARLSFMERMIRFTVSSVFIIIPLMFFAKGSRTIGPARSLRAS